MTNQRKEHCGVLGTIKESWKNDPEDNHKVFSSELCEEPSPGSRQIFVHVFYEGKSPPNKVQR